MARFLLLLTQPHHFARWDAAEEERRSQAFAAYNAFIDAVNERGTFVAGQALEPPATARTVRAGSTCPARVTDGPFLETVEEIGGFYVIEVEDLANAVDLAALLPRELDVEVRPCSEVAVF